MVINSRVVPVFMLQMTNISGLSIVRYLVPPNDFNKVDHINRATAKSKIILNVVVYIQITMNLFPGKTFIFCKLRVLNKL